MRIDKFYKNSFVLTLSNLVTGIIGFTFSIILSKKLGAEGLGLYGLIMPIYGLLLCLTSDGLVTALSRISAVYFNKKDFRNLNRTLTTIFAFILLWACTVAIIVFVSSSAICTHLLKDQRMSDSLKIICPALLFVPMSAILKGYFYGIGKFNIPATIDIFEKLFRVVILLSAIAVLSIHGTKNTVTTAYFSLAAGELISFSLLFTYYRRHRNDAGSCSSRSKHRVQLLFDVLVISCPLCLNGFISSVFSAASTLIIPHRLEYAGFDYSSALALIGRFMGMASNIVCLPMIIIWSMLTVMVPDISLSLSKKDFFSAESRITQVFKISYLVGISTFIIAMAIPDSLGILFYNRTDLAGMIRFAAFSCFIGYVASPTFGMLNGLGKQNANLRNSLIVSVEGLALIFILVGIRSVNIYGCGIELIITSVTSMLLNIHEIKKVCELKFSVYRISSYAAIGLFTYFVLIQVNNYLPDSLLILKVACTSILAFSTVFLMSRLV